MANITNYLNKIKTAVYGKEVRGAIHDAIKECYDDASVNHDNANMEVKMARGTYNTLNDRLDKSDEIQAQTNAQLSTKATKDEVNKILNRMNDVVSNVTNGNESATNTELVLARGGHLTLGERINSLESAICDAVLNLKPLLNLTGYIKSANGTLSEDTNWFCSDFISVDKFDVIYYDAIGHSNASSIAFYSENQTFIGCVKKDNSTSGAYKIIVNINDYSELYNVDIKYVRISQGNAEMINLKYQSIIYLFKDYAYLNKELEKIKATTECIHNKIDLLALCTNKGYVKKTDGNLNTSDANWVYSDFIEISKFEYFEIDVVAHGSVASVALYDKQGNFLISYGVTGTKTLIYSANIYVKDLSPEAFYMRISAGVTNPYESSPSTFYGFSSRIDSLYELRNKLFYPKNIIEKCTNIGYIDKTGNIQGSETDDHWNYSDYLSLNNVIEIYINAIGHSYIASVSFYDDSKKLIKGYGVESDGKVTDYYTNSITIENFPSNSKYFRICLGSETCPDISYVGDVICYYDWTSIVNETLENFKNSVGLGANLDLDFIVPPKIYTVCNDNVASLKGHNRNYSASVYLDHMFNLYNSDYANKENHIRIRNGVDKVNFYSPIKVVDSNESNPTVTYNNGSNILETETHIEIYGDDVVSKTLSTTHVSTLNSITKDAKPRILCIGDSITYGELATINDDDFAQNWVYHLQCKELFMKDKIDNSNQGFDCMFLGHYKKQRTMTYKNNDYEVTTFHEGIRGISLASYLNGNVSDFRSDRTGKFSINAWLSKFRTLDDNGNRLTVGNGTGTLIDESNVNTFDVCTPTHILIMLSSNNGFEIPQYRELVDIIKSEYPNMIIGMAIPDGAGTYFPSLHPNCASNTWMWNGNNTATHNQQFNCMKMLLDEFSNREDEGLYIVPFYFVQPTAESGALRVVSGMDAQFALTSNNVLTEQYGWGANVHINAVGHSTWAYQLYSWIKYTIAKSL